MRADDGNTEQADQPVIEQANEPVTEQMIVDGLSTLGLDGSRPAIVHVSLRSFGWVEGGAAAVCRALVEACGTVLIAAGGWDHTGVPAPPGLVRPHNAVHVAETWKAFDEALAAARVYSPTCPWIAGSGASRRRCV